MTLKNSIIFLALNFLYVVFIILLARFLPNSATDFFALMFCLTLILQTYINIRVLKRHKIFTVRRFALCLVGVAIIWVVVPLIVNFFIPHKANYH
jgi:hypothetical protein